VKPAQAPTAGSQDALPAMTPEAAKKRVLVLADYYSPGYKAGGAVRSLANFKLRLGDRLDISVLTRDHDLGDAQPYPSVISDAWAKEGGGMLYYASGSLGLGWRIVRAMRSARYDILYLNSFFSPHFTLLPLALRRCGLLPRVKTVLAPRGELCEGALSIKAIKKRAFLRAARWMGLYRGVHFQASADMEAADIRRAMGSGAKTSVAVDLPPPGVKPPMRSRRKERNSLRVVWFSRISRKKNLVGALELLSGVDLPIEFDIYGPIEDKNYWRECENAIEALGKVRVRHQGVLAHEDVVPTMAGYDLFLFPTFGENYGHVILEALLAGCPALLSDQTPWRDLEEKGVGWAFPLTRLEAFRKVLEACFRMGADDHAAMADRAQRYAASRLEAKMEEDSNLALFARP